MQTKQVMEFDCVCGKLLICIPASELCIRYQSSISVTCTVCTNSYNKNEVMYACDSLQNAKHHPSGYGFCGKCAIIIFNQESTQSNKPKHGELLYQRISNTIKYNKITRHSANDIDTNNAFLLQNVRIISQLTSQADKKLLLSDDHTNELKKRINGLVESILFFKQRYNMLSNRIHQTNPDNTEQLTKLKKIVTFQIYFIHRLKSINSKQFDKYWAYAAKFKQLRQVIFDKMTDKVSDEIYCICGNQMIEMLLCDSYGDTSFNCCGCGKDYTVITAPIMYECEMNYYSKYHKQDSTFIVCYNCKELMSLMTACSHIPAPEENDTIPMIHMIQTMIDRISVEYNPNIMIFVTNQFDIMDNTLSKMESNNDFDSANLFSLTNRYCGNNSLISLWNHLLTEVDKTCINKRKRAIYKRMEPHLCVCYCGHVLTPCTLTTKKLLHCDHCFKQIATYQILHVCVNRKLCEFWSNGHYFCDECAVKLKHDYKNINVEERIAQHLYDKFQLLLSTKTNANEEKETNDLFLNKLYIFANNVNKYQKKILEWKSNNCLENGKYFYNKLYDALRETIKQNIFICQQEIKKNEIKILRDAESVLSDDFECVWNNNGKLDDIVTAWYSRVAFDKKSKKTTFTLHTFPKPSCIKEINFDLILFIPRIGFFKCSSATIQVRYGQKWDFDNIFKLDSNANLQDIELTFEYGIKIKKMKDYNGNAIETNEDYKAAEIIHEERYYKQLKQLKNDYPNDIRTNWRTFQIENEKAMSFWQNKMIYGQEFESKITNESESELSESINHKLIFYPTYELQKNKLFEIRIMIKSLPDYVKNIEFELHIFNSQTLIYEKVTNDTRIAIGYILSNIFDCSLMNKNASFRAAINGEFMFKVTKVFGKNGLELKTINDVILQKKQLESQREKIKNMAQNDETRHKHELILKDSLLESFWKGNIALFDNHSLHLNTKIGGDIKDECDEIIIYFGIQNGEDNDKVRLCIFVKNIPFYINLDFDLEIFLFFPQIEQYHNCIERIKGNANVTDYFFDSAKLNGLKQVEIEIFVQLKNIKSRDKNGAIINLNPNNNYDIKQISNNYKIYYNELMNKFYRKREIDGQTRYSHETEFTSKGENKLKQLLDGQPVNGETVKCKIIPIFDPFVDDIEEMQVEVKFYKHTFNMFYIDLECKNIPVYLKNILLSINCFIPELYHYAQISFETNSGLLWRYRFDLEQIKNLTIFHVYMSIGIKYFNVNDVEICTLKDLNIAKQINIEKYNKLCLSNMAKYNNTLTISNDKKVNFDNDNLIESDTFNLFPFDMLQYLSCGYFRNEIEKNNNISVNYIPFEIKLLCIKYLPNIFKAESINICFSIQQFTDKQSIKFILNGKNKPIYIKQMSIDSNIFIKKVLFHKQLNSVFKKQSMAISSFDIENTELYKLKQAFLFTLDVASNVLLSNTDIICLRKKHIERFYNKRDKLLERMGECDKISMHKIIEIDGDHLKKLFKGSKFKTEWVFGDEIEIKIKEDLTLKLMASCQNYNGQFHYGVDVKKNDNVSKIELEINIFRPEMMDFISKIRECSSGKGFILGENNDLVSLQNVDCSSFQYELFIFINKVYDNKSNLINLS